MHEFIIIFWFILIFNGNIIESKFKIFNIINQKDLEFKGLYVITSKLNNLYFIIDNNYLNLSNKYNFFKIIQADSNSYYIVNKKFKKFLGFDGKTIRLFYENESIDIKRKIWNIFNVKKNKYVIQNAFNAKFIEVNNSFLLCQNKLSLNLKSVKKNFVFNFLKIYEEGKEEKKFLNIINKEPIDIVMKYIDLTDINLNRSNITQIYKDNDNEELRYSIRSILLNIPWVRKIFILMPNDKVRFFKSKEEIKEKIVYIKDKDFLGYDTANNVAFTLNLHKVEKFNVSNNFIYMDDDYFFGKPLFKKNFFYYDEEAHKIYPYVLTSKFNIINKTFLLNYYYKLYKKKDSIHPHSGKGFAITLFCTEKLFIENYNKILIKTEHTHNAISLNIYDMKEIFKFIQNYEYINETLFSKERYILRLSQQHTVNLFQLNVNNKKVNFIPYKYYKMELLNKEKLHSPLFVINTGGNHIPLKRQYKIQRKKMEKKFPYKNIFEIKRSQAKKNLNNIYLNVCLLIVFSLIKSKNILIFYELL